MESHGAVRAGILGIESVRRQECLEVFDRLVGGYSVGNEQLMSPGRGCQMSVQPLPQNIVQRHCPHQTALALDGEDAFSEGLGRCGGVHTEALMDAQGSVTAQVHVVLPPRRQGAHQHSVEFRGAPGAVYAADPAAPEEQLAVVRQLIAGIGHQVVEKTNGRQVGFDGGGRFAASLEELHIGKDVLWGNVGVPSRQEAAEAEHGLVIALLGAEAALPVVADQLVQLGDQILKML